MNRFYHKTKRVIQYKKRKFPEKKVFFLNVFYAVNDVLPPAPNFSYL